MSTATRPRRSPGLEATHVDPVTSAHEAGLRYVSDESPGIRRRPSGKAFTYLGLDGKPLRDPEALRRIKSLVIPPAWTDVWICPRADGHLQATGRDDAGPQAVPLPPALASGPRRDEVRPDDRLRPGAARHPQAGRGRPRPARPAAREGARHGRPAARNDAHPRRQRGVRPHEPLVRPDDDARPSRQGRPGRAHASPSRARAASSTTIDLADRRLARIVQKCRDLPGQELFQYLDDDGKRRDVDSADVNEYLREISGHDFTAKDFRTWAGTVLAAMALQEFEAFDSKTQAKKNIVRAIESVAERLGNTPTVCRKCYVHPEIIDVVPRRHDARDAQAEGRGRAGGRAGEPAARRGGGARGCFTRGWRGRRTGVTASISKTESRSRDGKTSRRAGWRSRMHFSLVVRARSVASRVEEALRTAFGPRDRAVGHGRQATSSGTSVAKPDSGDRSRGQGASPGGIDGSTLQDRAADRAPTRLALGRPR